MLQLVLYFALNQEKQQSIASRGIFPEMEGESFIFSGQGTIGFGRKDIISVLLTKSVILNVNLSKCPCSAKIVFILMQDYSLPLGVMSIKFLLSASIL